MNAVKRIEKETGPVDWIRSPIDVALAQKSVTAARKALLAEDREATPREIVFVLLREAARTEKAVKKPGPRGHVSCMPEAYHSESDIWVTEVAMTQDGITYPPRITHVASSAELQRYMEVVKWLRYVEGRDRQKSKELLWLLASGAPTHFISKRTGLHTQSAIRGAKYRRLGEIVKRLEEQKVFS